MTWPRLVINRNHLIQNAEETCRRCAAVGVSVSGVTKGMSALPDMAQVMVEGGCATLADSRLQNLAKLKQKGFTVPLHLMRLPMPSEVADVVQWADVSFVSSCEILELLNTAAADAKKRHGVLVMFELGDLREGILPQELEQITDTLARCHWLDAAGVGTNFGCFGSTIPTVEKLTQLAELGEEMERRLGVTLPFYSGGATSTLPLLNELPRRINNLRIGEALLLGTDTNHDETIQWLHQDVVTLEAEVIEVRRKPSVPSGPLACSAFGEKPVFEDRGERLRAIVAVGRQDLRSPHVMPLDDGVLPLGASSDHLLLDVENMTPGPKIGQILRFRMGYGDMLALFTSPYVAKVVV